MVVHNLEDDIVESSLFVRYPIILDIRIKDSNECKKTISNFLIKNDNYFSEFLSDLNIIFPNMKVVKNDIDKFNEYYFKICADEEKCIDIDIDIVSVKNIKYNVLKKYKVPTSDLIRKKCDVIKEIMNIIDYL